jgi:hypothetical protein
VQGFFEIDWDELRITAAPSYQCPNCGTRIYRPAISGNLMASVAKHECNEASIEEHHLSILRDEFDLFQASQVLVEIPGGTLWHPFEEWLATPEGEFERQWAEAHRP